MSENKNPWVVVGVGDGFAAARNGKNGIPEMGYHYYVEWQDAQQEADWNNEAEGITDAPRLMMTSETGPEKGGESMKQISEQDKKEIRSAACEAVAYSLIAGSLTTAVGKVGELFCDSQKPIDWENVFEQVEEMGDYVTAAFRYLKCARKEMQFLKNKQLELEGPRKVEK